MKAIFKYYISIFIILVSCNQNEKTTSKKEFPDVAIPDSTIYQVLNYVLSHQELNPDIKCNDLVNKDAMAFPFYFKSDSLELTKMDSIFSKADMEYILSQKKQFEHFTINPKYIRNKHIISNDSLNSYKSYCTISFPLFNIKKDIAIIRTSYYCGALCAHNGTYIYQKRNSNWVLLKVFQEAIS